MGIVGDVGSVKHIASAYVSTPKVADSENKPKTITVLGSTIPTGSTDGMEIEKKSSALSSMEKTCKLKEKENEITRKNIKNWEKLPKVGPTKANEEKLEEQRNASNPLKTVKIKAGTGGTQKGGIDYENLDYRLIDWTTGQLKTPFLSATTKSK